jgi:sulfur carrier protein
MKVTLNGKPAELPEEATLPDVLAILGFEVSRGLAVAVDSEVIPRKRWPSFDLSDGMKIEVLRAVQGG